MTEPHSNPVTKGKPPSGLRGNPLIAILLLAQGMIALCVGVGLSMATFGPPRPAIADVASVVLIVVGLIMLGMSFWVRGRSFANARKSRKKSDDA